MHYIKKFDKISQLTGATSAITTADNNKWFMFGAKENGSWGMNIFKNIKYTVKFLNYDGSVYNTQYVTNGSRAVVPSNLSTKTYWYGGTSFMEWTPDPYYKIITKDTTFTPMVYTYYNEFDLEFDANGESGLNDATYTVTNPTVPLSQADYYTIKDLTNSFGYNSVEGFTQWLDDDGEQVTVGYNRYEKIYSKHNTYTVHVTPQILTRDNYHFYYVPTDFDTWVLAPYSEFKDIFYKSDGTSNDDFWIYALPKTEHSEDMYPISEILTWPSGDLPDGADFFTNQLDLTNSTLNVDNIYAGLGDGISTDLYDLLIAFNGGQERSVWNAEKQIIEHPQRYMLISNDLKNSEGDKEIRIYYDIAFVGVECPQDFFITNFQGYLSTDFFHGFILMPWFIEQSINDSNYIAPKVFHGDGNELYIGPNVSNILFSDTVGYGYSLYSDIINDPYSFIESTIVNSLGESFINKMLECLNSGFSLTETREMYMVNTTYYSDTYYN